MTEPLPILAEWRAGFARMEAMPPPPAFPAKFWYRLIVDTRNFGICWGKRAAALGWTTLDVFGVDAASPYHRIDAAGLVSAITSFRVAEMDEATATILVTPPDITKQPEHTLTFTKPTSLAGRVPIWELP